MISRQENLGVLPLDEAVIRPFVKIDLVVAQLAQNLAEGSDRRPGSHSDPGLSGAFVRLCALLFGRKAKDGFADRMLLRAARRAAGGNVIVVVGAALPRHLRNRYSLSLSPSK